MLGRTLAVLFVAGVAAACASYTPSSAPVPDATKLQVLHQSDGLRAGAEPFSDEERQEAVFDADLNEAHVIAIQVLAENGSDREMLVRPTDMLLTLPTGTKISTASATAVVNKVGEEGSVVGATIAFGIIGMLAAGSAEDEASAARHEDYRRKLFKETVLMPNESAHGFVFFIPPKGTPSFDNAVLTVRFVDMDTALSEAIELELTGLGYDEAENKPISSSPQYKTN